MKHPNQRHNYQLRGQRHIVENTHAALFKEMGLGKTVTTLSAIDELIFDEMAIDTALVVAPKKVIQFVWEQEAAEWSHLQHLTFSRIHGTPKQRAAALRLKADIYLISRDNVAWLCGQFEGPLPFDALILDESSSFKNHRSQRFKALKMKQSGFKRVVELTGTPSPNGYLDLWAQLYLLDRGLRLEPFITRYREKYFNCVNRGGLSKYTLSHGAEQQIAEKIKDICLSMSAKDYLELPDTVINDVLIELDSVTAKKYKDFEKEKVLELVEGSNDPDDCVTAVNAAALAGKLLQFAGGAVYDSEKKVHEVHDLKIEALKGIIEDAQGSPVLVAWAYRHELHRIKAALKGYEVRELKTQKDKDDWDNGRIDVLLMHPASGGHGLNLQHGGNILVWFGQTWSLELYQQLNARLNRQGQTQRVIMHRLIAKGTMDEDVIKAIENKAKSQDGLMQSVKARIDKYLNF